MLLRNHTPFAAMGFGKLHRDGMVMAVIAVRASYPETGDVADPNGESVGNLGD